MAARPSNSSKKASEIRTDQNGMQNPEQRSSECDVRPSSEHQLDRGARVYHVGRPNIGDRQRLAERIDDLLDRRWLTNGGPYVQEFEERIAEQIGVKHCIAACNATVGLEMAIRALGLHGEVIVPSFTFVATAHALQWLQITPVFLRCRPADRQHRSGTGGGIDHV